MIWFLLFSAIAHYSVLNYELDKKQVEESKRQSSSKSNDLKNRKNNSELVAKENDQTIIKARLKKEGDTQSKSKVKPCAGRTYVGIGVNLIGYSGRVSNVAEGYGAHKAGIRVGDFIEFFVFQGVSYTTLFDIQSLIKENDTIEVAYTRNDIMYKVLIKVEKICTRR